MIRLATITKKAMYWIWCAKHPFATYSDFYVHEQVRRIERKGRHQTLGPSLLPLEGMETLKGLRSLGLKPSHRVLDYGCGRLRSGRHLISFLERGNYVGLDVTSAFFLQGLKEISPELIREKMPEMHVISRQSIGNLSLRKHDFILLEGVLQCVPPREIPSVMRRVNRLCSKQTKIIVSLLEGPRSMSVGSISFRHSLSDFASACERLGLEVEILQRGLEVEALAGGDLLFGLERPKVSDDLGSRVHARGLSPMLLEELGAPELGAMRATILRIVRGCND